MCKLTRAANQTHSTLQECNEGCCCCGVASAAAVSDTESLLPCPCLCACYLCVCVCVPQYAAAANCCRQTFGAVARLFNENCVCNYALSEAQVGLLFTLHTHKYNLTHTHTLPSPQTRRTKRVEKSAAYFAALV